MHEETKYAAALAAAATRPSVASLDALQEVAAAFARSAHGRARVEADWARADAAAQFEVAAVLRSAVLAAQRHGLAGAQIREMTGPVTPTGRLPGWMMDWRADQPVWLKADDVTEMIRGAGFAEPDWPVARAAFRQVYATAWAEQFQDGQGQARLPEDDRTGWLWRKAAAAAAKSRFRGAGMVAVQELTAGWTVFTGRAVHTVRTVQVGLPVQVALPDGTVAGVPGCTVTFFGAGSVGPVAGSVRWVRLPALEQGRG